MEPLMGEIGNGKNFLKSGTKEKISIMEPLRGEVWNLFLQGVQGGVSAEFNLSPYCNDSSKYVSPLWNM